MKKIVSNASKRMKILILECKKKLQCSLKNTDKKYLSRIFILSFLDNNANTMLEIYAKTLLQIYNLIKNVNILKTSFEYKISVIIQNI